MKAFAMDRYGGPEVLSLRDLPEPEPGPNDLLLDVQASSVNPIDFKTRVGGVKPLIKNRFPLVLGCDVSGTVVKVGWQVKRFAPGDEIFARLQKDRVGAFAERALVAEEHAAPKPAKLSHAEAASIPLVGLTSWQALVDIAKVQKGDRVLIHAGSGGVGTFAIQLARHLGAVVVTTASAKNKALVTRLGASEVIDYKTQRFESAVAPPCRVVFDTQGGDTLKRSFEVVENGGVIVTIGGTPDRKFAKAWPMSPVHVLALSVLMYPVARRARAKDVHFEYLFMLPHGEQLGKIGALLEDGTIVPVIDRTFPFTETKEALAYVESGRAVGKVVIVRG
jgi:alcohol dehydrogenase